MALRLGLRDWGPAEHWAGIFGAIGLRSQASDEVALTRWFSESFSTPALLLNSGSSALQLALTLLAERQPERNEVLLPALACPALTRVVLTCGLTPRYVDIGSDLNTPVQELQAGLSPRSLAVVMVHAYGHPADSAGIQALCRRHDVALIDDAAQRVEPGSGLGTAGDFGIFSFAQSKSVVCGIDGSGGVLLVNSLQHLASLQQRWMALPIAGQRRLAWLQFVLGPSTARAAYYLSRWRHRGTAPSKAPARIGSIDAAIARAQISSLSQRRERRLQLLKRYQQALDHSGIVAPQMASNSSPDYLARLMVRVLPDQRDNCRKALAAGGIASRLPYRLPSALDRLLFPQATRSAAELLELPLPSTWTDSDIDRVARCVAAYACPRVNT